MLGKELLRKTRRFDTDQVRTSKVRKSSDSSESVQSGCGTKDLQFSLEIVYPLNGGKEAGRIAAHLHANVGGMNPQRASSFKPRATIHL